MRSAEIMNNKFKNRIVATAVEDPRKLLSNPKNWRIHPEQQQEALTTVLNDVGWVQDVIVNKTTGHILDGHLRVKLAIANKEKEIPVKYVEVTEAEERLILATFDPIAALAEADKEKLKDLIVKIDSDNEELDSLLEKLAATQGVYLEAENDNVELNDPGDDIAKASEAQEKWKVKAGDAWGLGDHRIVCGDCTDSDALDRLFQGEKAEMLFTDPPYGVNYEGGHFHSGDVKIKRRRTAISGDNDSEIYDSFLSRINRVIDGPCYMFFSTSGTGRAWSAAEDNQYTIHAIIVWYKINATYAAMGAQYKNRYEPILYFKPKQSTLRWCGPADETTVWEIKRDAVNDLHPTQKPVELALRAIGNHTSKTVADVFLGAGSTLMACEQLGRKCYGMEIEPKYVAVTLERWSTATGKKPIKV